MRSAINLGEIFGIEFRLHYTWFLIFIFVTILLVSPNYSNWSYWIIAIVVSLLFFASVLAHELAHSLVGRSNGIPIERITLFIFGGVAEMTGEATRPTAELKMAIAGPFCSLIIGGLFGLLWLLIPETGNSLVDMVFWLALSNWMLAIFNLIPGFPLDGGRIFRSLLWHFTGSYNRSTRIAARAGQGVGIIFILGGITTTILAIFVRLFALSWFDVSWFAFIGWFLVNVASASYRQIQEQEKFAGAGGIEPTVTDSQAFPPDSTGN